MKQVLIAATFFGLFFGWPSSSPQAGYLGIEVTSFSTMSYTPVGFTETQGIYIRPLVDLRVTHLGYYDGFRALAYFFERAYGDPGVAGDMTLTDDHPLGIYEIDPSYAHNSSEPGNGVLIASTTLHVGEGIEENCYRFKSIDPVVLHAGRIYAIAGFGSNIPPDNDNYWTNDGDPVGVYWDYNTPDDPGAGALSFGPGYELLGGAFSYLSELSEPLWITSDGGISPNFLLLGPGFKYEFVETAAVPEPSSLVMLGSLGAIGCVMEVLRRRRTASEVK